MTTKIINVKLKVKITNVEHFKKGQALPELHVFLASPYWDGPRSVKVIELEYADIEEQKEFETDLDAFVRTDEALDGYGTRAFFSLFVHTMNGQGQWCRMHKATGNIPLKDLSDCGTLGKKVHMRNKNAKIKVGEVVVTNCDGIIPDMVSDSTFTDPKKLALIDMAFATLAKREMLRFTGWSALDADSEFVTHVHAPFYRGQIVSFPGFGYVMCGSPLMADEDWYINVIAEAVSRHAVEPQAASAHIRARLGMGKSDKDVTRMFHEHGVKMLATMASIVVCCYPYETDFYVKDGTKESFESFDDIFVRCAGDCEDYGRGVVVFLSAFRDFKFRQSNAYAKLGEDLQEVSKLYVNGVVLATVAQNSHGFSVNKSRQAHMYAQMIPRKQFLERILLSGAPKNHDSWRMGKDKGTKWFQAHGVENPEVPWLNDLRSYVVEGTAPVAPFTAVAFEEEFKDEDKVQTEMKARKAARGMPKGLERIYRPSWAVTPDAFYQLGVHFYTPDIAKKYASLREAQRVVEIFKDIKAPATFGAGWWRSMRKKKEEKEEKEKENEEEEVTYASFAFWSVSKEVYGVPMQETLNMDENLIFLPHQKFTQDTVDFVNMLTRYSHPTPTVSLTHSNTVVRAYEAADGGRIQKFLDDCSVALSSTANVNLYSDFTVKRAHEQDAKTLQAIASHVVHEGKSGTEVFLEGSKVEDFVVRIRAYV